MEVTARNILNRKARTPRLAILGKMGVVLDPLPACLHPETHASPGCFRSLPDLSRSGASALARLGPEGVRFMLTYEYGSLKILFAAVAFLTCMYYFDLYNSAVVSNRREALVRLIQVMGVAYITLGFFYYLYPPLKLGRGVFHIGFLLVGVLLLIWRRLFSIINSVPGLAERVVILGEGPLAESLLHEIETRPELGIRIAGRAEMLANGNHSGDGGRGELPMPISESSFCQDLAVSGEIRGVDRIVVAMEERRGKLPVDLLLALKNRGVRVQDGNDVYESITGKVPIESIRSSWLLFSPGSHVS